MAQCNSWLFLILRIHNYRLCNSTPSRLVWLVIGWLRVVRLLLWVVLRATTLGVWTAIESKGRDSGRGPGISVGIEGGWSAKAGNGLLEMPIPLRINSPMSL